MGKKSKSKSQSKNKGNNDKSKNSKSKIKKQKPRNMEQFQNTIKIQSNQIKNKEKRIQIHTKRRLMKNQIKAKQRKMRKKLPSSQRQMPQTIQDKQIGTQQFKQDYDQQNLDQFNKFFTQQSHVKVLITTCLKPHTKIYNFIRQLMMVFHNIAYYPRRNMKLNQVYEYAKQLNFTHTIVVRYTHGWELLIRCLSGPMALFRVTSLKFQKEIYHHAVATDNYPQLILNNFDSRIGVRVGRLLNSLFPQNPDFKGRRVVTFHNQRDFIFFRHHRYIFRQGFQGVHLQQIGPSFTLKLLKLYSGDQNQVKGLEFQAKDQMYVDRKKVYL